MDVFSLDDVGQRLGVELDPVLADAASLLEAIVQYYGTQDAPKAVEPSAKAIGVAAPKPGSATESSIKQSLERFVSGEPGIASASLVIEPEEIAEAAQESAAAAYDQEPEPFTTVTPSEAPEPDAEPASDVVVSETLEQMAAATAPQGPPAIDLDVLAVADATKVTLLVADILEDAAHKGATRIHLLPYKDDFFLVYRVKGRLEKISSAPLSLQGRADRRVQELREDLGRAGQHAGTRSRARPPRPSAIWCSTVSVVPTIAGQRMVDLALAAALRAARSGFARHERGRDPRAPGDGRARPGHPARRRTGRRGALVDATTRCSRTRPACGKTVYSVERSIEYEIPAVAQVLVNPGSPIGASSYLAVGIRQDTDVLAIDGLQSVDDIQLAVEAAGAGRARHRDVRGGSIVGGGPPHARPRRGAARPGLRTHVRRRSAPRSHQLPAVRGRVRVAAARRR